MRHIFEFTFISIAFRADARRPMASTCRQWSLWSSPFVITSESFFFDGT